MDHPFRSAAIGGFNRQDVLTYLENITKESAQQKQAVQDELEQAQAQAARLDGELSELRARFAAAEQEKETLRQQLEQANVALTGSRGENTRLTAELTEAGQELEQLRGQIAALQPDAQAYRELKERTAGVELEAHRRAQTIQEKAEGDARQLRRQMEKWMQRVSREYDSLRTEVETTVSHADAQLDKAGRCLEQATELLNEREVALESLAQAYAETDPARAAAPMPLSEND